MTIWEYLIGGIIILFALIIIAIVLLQEGKQAGVGAVTGGDSYMDRGNARTNDARLSRWTKVLAIAFFVLVFLGMLVTQFLGA